MFQTPIRAISTGRLSAQPALRKCWSIAFAPARNCSKFALADGNGQRHADRGPHGIAATDPVPHLEAVVLVHAEGVHGLVIGGHGREVLGDDAFAELADQPGARGVGIGQRLKRREGLGGDDEQRGRGVRVLEHIVEVAAIDVRDELHPRRPLVNSSRASTAMAGPRSEPPMPIFTTRVKGLPALPTMRPSRTAFGEIQHALALGNHLAGDGAGPDRGALRLAQGHMQHRAILGAVDVFALNMPSM